MSANRPADRMNRMSPDRGKWIVSGRKFVGSDVDGVHDLGGLDGFGPSSTRRRAPFRRGLGAAAFRVMMGLSVRWPGGLFRHSIERMDPAHYLSSSYYEHWLTGAATMAVEPGSRPRTNSTAAQADASRCPAPDRGVLPGDLTRTPSRATPSATKSAFVLGTRPATPARRATCRASAGPSCDTTGAHDSPTSLPMAADPLPTRSIRCASRHASCGARPERRRSHARRPVRALPRGPGWLTTTTRLSWHRSKPGSPRSNRCSSRRASLTPTPLTRSSRISRTTSVR